MAQAGDQRRVFGGYESGSRASAGFALHPGDLDGALDANGNSVQWAEWLVVYNGRFSFARLAHHTLRFEVDEGIQLRIESFDFLQVRFSEFYGGNFTIADFLRHFYRRKECEVTQNSISGTKAESSMRTFRRRLLIFSRHSQIERLFFFQGKHSTGTLRKISEKERPDRHADQAKNFDIEPLEHAPNMTILSFVQDDLKPAILFSRTQQGGPTHSQKISILGLDSFFESSGQFAVRDRGNLHVIGLLKMCFWCGNPGSPGGIVGEKKKTLTAFVEATHGCDPRERFARSLQDGVRGVAAFLVGCSGHKSARLVHDEINLLLRLYAAAIDNDSIHMELHRRFRIAANSAVQEHATLANQLTGLRTRAISELRKGSGQTKTSW